MIISVDKYSHILKLWFLGEKIALKLQQFSLSFWRVKTNLSDDKF